MTVNCRLEDRLVGWGDIVSQLPLFLKWIQNDSELRFREQAYGQLPIQRLMEARGQSR